VGGALYFCGQDLETQRIKLVSMYRKFDERKLTEAVTDAYNAMKYIDPIAKSCYVGALEVFTYDQLVNLWANFDLI
jgi:hypothetical protein